MTRKQIIKMIRLGRKKTLNLKEEQLLNELMKSFNNIGKK